MSSDCVFCKIINGEIPAAIVHRNEQVTATCHAIHLT
jgi:diadenosine tetraphosphate (Ap4A) HIT family hydrolase